MRVSWSLLLLLSLSLFSFAHARKYITDIPCTEDSECNWGDCFKEKCRCKDMYYSKEIDGNVIPCYGPVGELYPAATLSFIITFLIILLCLTVTHISVAISLSINKKEPKTKRLLQSWQYDPRFTLINMGIACLITIVWTACFLNYAFGNSRSYLYAIINDLAKVFYFEAGAAVIFYWFVAVEVARGKSRTIVKFPYMIISMLVFMFWWCFSSFVPFVARDAARYVNLLLGIAILIFIICGLAYYGRKVISMLSPDSQASNRIIKKISIFLYMAVATIIGDGIFIVIIASFNSVNSPAGFIGTLWGLMILEVWIQIVFLVTFGGGSFGRIARTVAWVLFRGRTGKNPLEENLLLMSHDENSAYPPTDATPMKDVKTTPTGTATTVTDADAVSVIIHSDSSMEDSGGSKDESTTPR